MSAGRPVAPVGSSSRPAERATPATAIRSELAAAVVLALLTLVALPGTRGILGGGRSLVPVMAAALAMHVLAVVCRHRFGQAGFLVALAGSPLLIAWLAIPGTTFLGIPWTGTWRAGADGLRRALEALGTGEPPGLHEAAALQQGRLTLAVLCVAVCALMADQAAFRMRQASLALVPSFTLVLLRATRAPAQSPGLAIGAFLVVAMAFLLIHHAMADRAATTMVRGRAPQRVVDLAPAGAVLAVVVVVTALIVGPLLPGYGRPAIVAAVGSVLSRQQTGSELSSLVDLSPTLIEHSDAVMFAVSSPIPAYWRLASLDRFDGRVWSRGAGAEESGADFTTTYIAGFPTTQDFEIEGLRSEWLPAAYRAHRVEGDAGFLDPADPSTVRRRGPARSGQHYQVESLIPTFAPVQLDQLGVPSSGPTLGRYLALPPDLPPSVAGEAARVARTAQPGGPYRVALALQSYFRQGFAYDLHVRPSHNEDALISFLFRTRRGYCEQFAAAFAVMARADGLPARVAVGFTPGDLGSDGRYQVRGMNAHAWPEVYFQGAGWVAFEPTPGRGMPGAQTYTGVTPAQASYQPAPPADAGGAPTSTTTTIASAVTPTSAFPTTPTTGSTASSAVLSGTTTLPRGTPVPRHAQPAEPTLVPLAAAGAAVAAATGVVLAKRFRRLSRRRRAAGPNARVIVAWTEAAEALAASGLGRHPSETILDHATRAAADSRLPQHLAKPILALAGRAGTASYSGRRVGTKQATEASATAALIEEALRREAPPYRRLGRALDPRPLWRTPSS